MTTRISNGTTSTLLPLGRTSKVHDAKTASVYGGSRSKSTKIGGYGEASLVKITSGTSRSAITKTSTDRTASKHSHRNSSSRLPGSDESSTISSRSGRTPSPSPPLHYREYAANYRPSKRAEGLPAATQTITKEMQAIKVSPVPVAKPRALVGLQNLGNTCFMNSCLQCLNNLEDLAKQFESKSHLNDINPKSMSEGKIASVFGNLAIEMWQSEAHTAVRPTDLKKIIGKYADRFLGYEQHDAQEFLRFLLDGLHEDLNRIKEKPPYYEIKDREDATDRSISDEYWKYYFDRNSSLLSDLFCGQLKSEVICCKCNHRSICFDVFWDLSVPIPGKNKSSGFRRNLFNKEGSKCTLENCLQAYTEEEHMKEDDAYYCSKCKTHRPVYKTIGLYRAPEVLVIHLKRFSFTAYSRDKVSRPVEFPTKNLELSPYFAEDAVVSGDLQYDLCGVVNHMGNLNGGHYTADCLNPTTKEWYNFNDARVTSLNKSGGLDPSSAYILFYKRRH